MKGLEEESKNLRDKGANAIILLTHFGLVCNQIEALKLNIYNKSSTQSICFRAILIPIPMIIFNYN